MPSELKAAIQRYRSHRAAIETSTPLKSPYVWNATLHYAEMQRDLKALADAYLATLAAPSPSLEACLSDLKEYCYFDASNNLIMDCNETFGTTRHYWPTAPAVEPSTTMCSRCEQPAGGSGYYTMTDGTQRMYRKYCGDGSDKDFEHRWIKVPVAAVEQSGVTALADEVERQAKRQQDNLYNCLVAEAYRAAAMLRSQAAENERLLKLLSIEEDNYCTAQMEKAYIEEQFDAYKAAHAAMVESLEGLASTMEKVIDDQRMNLCGRKLRTILAESVPQAAKEQA